VPWPSGRCLCCFLLNISKLLSSVISYRDAMLSCHVEHLCHSNALGCHITVLHLMRGHPRAVSYLGIPCNFGCCCWYEWCDLSKRMPEVLHLMKWYPCDVSYWGVVPASIWSSWVRDDLVLVPCEPLLIPSDFLRRSCFYSSFSW
jgi:hypothetical protein